MSGGIVDLVGLQGVGKSSALLAILIQRMISEREAWRKKHKSYPDLTHHYDTIKFKWRRESELFPSLIDAFIDYNQRRIHSALRYMTPYEYLEKLKVTQIE